MNSLSVVICAYNEEKNVSLVIEETLQVLTSMAVDFELIVVDDGSKDNTLQVVRASALKDARIKIIVHGKNQGIGSALLDGFHLAQKDLVTFLPADGQINPQDIKLFAKSIDGFDMVVSYYVQRPSSVFRLLTSKGVRVLLFLLFGKMPHYEGTYMFRRAVLNNIPLKMHASFVLNYELVIRAKRQGYKIKEVPVVCRERMSGASKVLSFKKILFVFRQTSHYVLKSNLPFILYSPQLHVSIVIVIFSHNSSTNEESSMPNDYSSRQGQSAADKASEFARSAGQQVEEKGKEMAGDAQKKLKEGQEQASKIMETVDKQVRDNPWPVIAGVAVGSFLLGALVSKSNK